MTSALQVTQKLSLLLFVVCGMLAMGLRLAPRSLVAPLRDPRLVLLAIFLNFAIAPAFAWVLGTVLPLDHGYALGLLLLGASAGAPFLPTLVERARGDLPLAVALMALLSGGTILFLPLALPFMAPGLGADPIKIALPLLLLIAAPLGVGIVIRNRAPGFAAYFAPVATKIGNASLLVLFVLLVALNYRSLLGLPGTGVVAAAVVYFFVLFSSGYFAGGTKAETRSVLGLATGARNFGAALVPAGSFGDSKAELMIVVAAIVTLLCSFAIATRLRNRPVPGAI